MFPTLNTILIKNTEKEFSNIKIQLKKINNLNYKNCDIYVDDHNLLLSCGNYGQRFYSKEKFDTKDVKNLEINYSTKTNEFHFNVPLLSEIQSDIISNENLSLEDENKFLSDRLDLMKMRKITDTCLLVIDNDIKMKLIQTNYPYGFNGNYLKDANIKETNGNVFNIICKINQPYNLSFIDRTIAREKDEIKDFSRDQYKIHFIELQVPDGYENPMSYLFNFKDFNLTGPEERALKSINSKQLDEVQFNKNEIECGLISILLAICYDIRTTHNEPTCESAWTRTILSSTLSYFELINYLGYTIEIFIRRSLIYPLYRNSDLSRLCVQDVIKALQNDSRWILKQLLITYNMFQQSPDDRQILNELYIEDYIRYLCNYVTADDFKLLSKNLKNSFYAVTKKSIRLDLIEIETELLKELIDDVHLDDSDSDDENTDSSIDENVCSNNKINSD